MAKISQFSNVNLEIIVNREKFKFCNKKCQFRLEKCQFRIKKCQFRKKYQFHMKICHFKAKITETFQEIWDWRNSTR